MNSGSTWLLERGHIDSVRWLETGEVFEQFLARGEAMFVTGPVVPGSVNVATMPVAVRGCLSPRQQRPAHYNLPMGALPDSQSVGVDLRTFD